MVPKGTSFIDVFLPFYLILAQYYYGPFSLGNYILVFAAVVYIARNPERRFRFDRGLFIFLLYASVVQISMMLGWSLTSIGYIAMIANMLVAWICLGVLHQQLHIEKTMKYFELAVAVVLVGEAVQCYQVYFLNARVDPIVILPLTSNDNWAWSHARPMSFFQEPQALASYLSLFVLIEARRGRMLIASFATAFILLSGSTQGIVLAATVWVLILLSSEMSFGKKLGILMLGVCLLSMFMYLPIFDYARQKLLSAGSTGSDYSRLWKAFDTYFQLPFINCIFGIGGGMLNPLIESSVLSFSWMDSINIAQNGYMSMLFGVFVNYGLIGGLLYWFSLLHRVSLKSDFLSSAIVLLIVVNAASSSVFFGSPIFTLYMMMSYAFTSSDKGWLYIGVR